MNLRFRMNYFKSIYERYQEASKCLKIKILDEFCKICGYNRKYAIFKLNSAPPQDKIYAKQVLKNMRKGAVVYSHEAVAVISKVWEAADYPCSTRLKVILSLWMTWIIKHFNPSLEIQRQMLKISPRQLDRRLKPYRFKVQHRIYGRTKHGTLLKHHIPIKTNHWNVKEPGFTEVDTVSHSGNSGAGEFAYSVSQTDIFTGWVETRAVLGKGERNISSALDETEEVFPFKILGMNSDNGGEFINHLVYNRNKSRNIDFTRGRPNKKDDNAHIEQKNWTHVRKLMGWYRYDTSEVVYLMNDLYKNELHLFMNLFMPSMKVIHKHYLAGRSIPHYDNPTTPLDRVIASGKGDPAKIAYYKKIREQTDPFELSKSIARKLEAIYNKANCRFSPKPAPEENNKTQKGKQKLNKHEDEALKSVAKMFGIPITKNGKTYNGQG